MIETTDGVGIEFLHNCVTCITLARTGLRLKVSANISTFNGITAFTEHFYGVLDVLPTQSKEILTGKTFSSNEQPAASRAKHISISHKAPHTTYKEHLGRKVLDVKKGESTMRFVSIHSLILSIESTFKKLFGDGWILVGSNYEPWEEYKEEIISVYGN